MLTILTCIRLRYYTRSFETEHGTVKTRTLQYAQFSYNPVTKQEDQEVEWEDVPEVDERDEPQISEETKADLEAAETNESLPAFLIIK